MLRRTRLTSTLGALLAGLVLPLAGCGSDATSSAGGRGGGAAALPASTELTVLAAASLTPVLPGIDQAFSRANAGVTVTPDFDGTQVLETRLENAPSAADVFISADTTHMDDAVTKRLVGPPRTLARNRLVVVVPRGNPAHIAALADLGRDGVKVVLADPSVPAGKFAAQTAQKAEQSGDAPAGFTARLAANTVSKETSVRAVLQKVEGGEVDAGIVYTTDAASVKDVDSVAIADRDQTLATYRIAVSAQAPHPRQAQAFVDYLLGPDAQAALQGAGFLPPL